MADSNLQGTGSVRYDPISGDSRYTNNLEAAEKVPAAKEN
jgi:hypothetical protein